MFTLLHLHTGCPLHYVLVWRHAPDQSVVYVYSTYAHALLSPPPLLLVRRRALGQAVYGGKLTITLLQFLVLTQYCRHQYCMVYGIQRESQ